MDDVADDGLLWSISLSRDPWLFGSHLRSYRFVSCHRTQEPGASNQVRRRIDGANAGKTVRVRRTTQTMNRGSFFLPCSSFVGFTIFFCHTELIRGFSKLVKWLQLKLNSWYLNSHIFLSSVGCINRHVAFFSWTSFVSFTVWIWDTILVRGFMSSKNDLTCLKDRKKTLPLTDWNFNTIRCP